MEREARRLAAVCRSLRVANPRRNHAPCRAPAGGWRLATAIVRQVPIVPAWYVAQWGRPVPGRRAADGCQRLHVFLHDGAAGGASQWWLPRRSPPMNALGGSGANIAWAASTSVTRIAAKAWRPRGSKT